MVLVGVVGPSGVLLAIGWVGLLIGPAVTRPVSPRVDWNCRSHLGSPLPQFMGVCLFRYNQREGHAEQKHAEAIYARPLTKVANR